jgi:phosphoglycerate dehydrogenase-like enzyme
MTDTTSYTVLIASYLEPEYVDRIRAVDSRLRVVYEPSLLRPPRYAADHVGSPVERTPGQETRWRQLLREADILFDFDQTHREDLPELAPHLKWVQATSAGIGKLVKDMAYDTRMPDTVFTTASGVHAQPLAEFCLMGMLAFHKGLHRIMRDQQRKHWERYAGTDMAGRSVVIVGVGSIGREVARVCKALRMIVIGVDLQELSGGLDLLGLDEFYLVDELHSALKNAEHLVLIVPHTQLTERMIGAEELAILPQGAIVINIGRGALIDEPALVAALRSGHLGGAVLDVFAEEPLPQDSPLWNMPNVLVSPHSGSTSDRENSRLTDLFCENLRRFLAGKQMLNVLDPRRMF